MANGKIEENKSRPLILKTFSQDHGSAIAVGNRKRWTPAAFEYDWPEGYYPIAICDFSTGSQHTAFCYIQSHNRNYPVGQTSNYFICFRNVGTAATSSTNTTLVKILFAPLEMVDELS